MPDIETTLYFKQKEISYKESGAYTIIGRAVTENHRTDP